MSYSAAPWDAYVVLPMGCSIDIVRGAWTNAPGALAWATANKAIYVPHRVTAPILVKRLWFAGNNATGNVDVGIYTLAGTKIVTTGAV